MSVKTITITEGAYNSLKALKKEHESFSEVIGRVTKKKSLMDCFGVLSKEEADRMEKAILDGRKVHRTLQKERMQRLWGR